MVAALAFAGLIVAMLLFVVWVSFHERPIDGAVTWDHYVTLTESQVAMKAALNTVALGVLTLVVAFAFGAPIAWLVERSDLGGKTLVYSTMTVAVLIPGFFTAMGWVFLLHPRIGVINQQASEVFGIDHLFNVASLPGMGWVQGLSLAPIIFVMTSSSLRAMDSSLEEAAQVSGASRLTVLRRITFPLILPAVIGAALFTFAIAIATFDVPVIIGFGNRILTFSTFLYLQLEPGADGLPPYGVAAAFGTLMALVAIAGAYWYTKVLSRARHYEVVTGNTYRREPVRLSRPARRLARGFVGAYVGLAFVFPVAMLVWTSVQPFPQFPSVSALGDSSLDAYRDLQWTQLRSGLSNTLKIALSVPTLALIIALTFSWTVVRSRSRFRLVFDYVAFLPHAVPRLLFALAALVFGLYVSPGPLDLHGSMILIVVVMAVTSISLATRIINSSLVQISGELEEAARMAGASGGAAVRRIVLPLLRPALVGTWVWLAMLAIRELSVPAILYSPHNAPLTVVTFRLWQQGNYNQASAVTILTMLVLGPLVFLYWRRGLGKFTNPGLAGEGDGPKAPVGA